MLEKDQRRWLRPHRAPVEPAVIGFSLGCLARPGAGDTLYSSGVARATSCAFLAAVKCSEVAQRRQKDGRQRGVPRRRTRGSGEAQAKALPKNPY
jgi:hypothetical protein